MCPLEAYVLQVNVALLCHHKEASLTFTLTVPNWWKDLLNSIRAAESVASFKKQLNTSLPSLFNALTLARSTLNLFYRSVFLFKKTPLTVYQLHIYSLTSFSWKTNKLSFLLFYLLRKYKLVENMSRWNIQIKKTCYVYCVNQDLL